MRMPQDANRPYLPLIGQLPCPGEHVGHAIGIRVRILTEKTCNPLKGLWVAGFCPVAVQGKKTAIRGRRPSQKKCQNPYKLHLARFCGRRPSTRAGELKFFEPIGIDIQ